MHLCSCVYKREADEEKKITKLKNIKLGTHAQQNHCQC